MRVNLTTAAHTAFLVALGLLVGCGGDARVTDIPPESGHDDHDHAHPSEGPHGGALIELGNEEYHAELVHDEAVGTVTIYLLDSTAGNPVRIDAGEITINASHEGQAEQFQLASNPKESDPEGQSSRFVSSDKELGEHLDHGEARLNVTIDGKPYSGKIPADHGHDH